MFLVLAILTDISQSEHHWGGLIVHITNLIKKFEFIDFMSICVEISNIIFFDSFL